MTRKEAVKNGFIIDDGQRPCAYKGPRFSPTEWYEVPTEAEERLTEILEKSINMINEFLDVLI